MLSDALFLNSNRVADDQEPYGAFDGVVGNLGNQYIGLAVSKLLDLDPKTTIWNESIWRPGCDGARLAERAARAKVILLNLQDHLRADFPDEPYQVAYRLLRSLESISAPLIVFSLAANALEGSSRDVARQLSPDKLRFFEYLIERAASIGARGDFTAGVLEKLGATNVGVVGCASYFESGEGRSVRPVETESNKDLALTGDFRLVHGSERVQYFLQGDHEWPLIDVGYMPDELWRRREPQRRPLRNESDIDVVRALADGRASFFTDLKAWKRHVAATCSAVVGSRLHAAILALNAGVAAAVTNPDARARESCEFFGIPWLAHEQTLGKGPAEVARLCAVDRLNELYPRRYAAFVEWLRENGLGVAEPPGPGFDLQPLPRVPLEVVRGRAREEAHRQIGALYRSYFGRHPRPAEVETWMDSLRNGGTFAEMRNVLRTAEEGRRHRSSAITELYETYFGRSPRPAEVDVWERSIDGGMTLEDMRSVLLEAEEGGRHTDAVITGSYQECFGRGPDPSELETWRGTIRGGGTFEDLRWRLLVDAHGADRLAALIDELYRKYFGREALAQERAVWAEALGRPGMVEEVRAAFSDSRPGAPSGRRPVA